MKQLKVVDENVNEILSEEIRKGIGRNDLNLDDIVEMVYCENELYEIVTVHLISVKRVADERVETNSILVILENNEEKGMEENNVITFLLFRISKD